METIFQLGAFQVTSTKLVVTDPRTRPEQLGQGRWPDIVEPCLPGEWKVELTEEVGTKLQWELPKSVSIVHAEYFPGGTNSPWVRASDGLGGNTGLTGVYDFAHYFDDSIIPKGHVWKRGEPGVPEKLWYSFNVDADDEAEKSANVIPYGVVVNWDGGWDIDLWKVDGIIVGVRMLISGWGKDV